MRCNEEASGLVRDIVDGRPDTGPPVYELS